MKERSKQGQTNKQGKATQHTQGSHVQHKGCWIMHRCSLILCNSVTVSVYSTGEACLHGSSQPLSPGFLQNSRPHIHLVHRQGKNVNYFAYGASASEVEVDFTILRSDLVMDVGDSLNPAIDIGQVCIYGG